MPQKIEQQLFDNQPEARRDPHRRVHVLCRRELEMYCPVDSHEAHGMKGDVEVPSSTPGGARNRSAILPQSIYLIACMGAILLGIGLVVRRPHITSKCVRF